ncbi:MAG TPA: hypothetical protein VEF76_03825 [Patescibacteria group bacterium]|nr:hypothetical protein [Patescibacteria group bacterium]
MPDSLASNFDEKASRPALMSPGEYRDALERLLGEGQGFGKTEPVAAYFLDNLLLNDDTVKVQPLYLVMDIKQWPNDYGRSLVMQDIFTQYAKRMVGENELNMTDFKGPGIWTAKKSAVEGDYIRREGKNEYGRPSNLWDPNPKAFRLASVFNNAATIPTTWGTWTMEAGGALAVRETDVPALAAALLSVRDGSQTIESALYTVNAEGQSVAKFDVYGMAPNFLEQNYKPVSLTEETYRVTAAFKPPAPTPLPLLVKKRG